FEMLKANMPKAFESVQVKTIRLWEYCMHRWIEAYRSGLPMREAQLRVQLQRSGRLAQSRCTCVSP
ncbi:hypothetical protein BDR04DRAFT_1018399, partial [Suillus decipiens]